MRNYALMGRSGSIGLLALVALSAPSCGRERDSRGGAISERWTPLAPSAPRVALIASSAVQAEPSQSAFKPTLPTAKSKAQLGAYGDRPGPNTLPWKVLGDETLGPPTQALATRRGLSLVTSTNEILTVRTAARATGTSFLERLPESPSWALFGRAPTLSGNRLYWVRERTLFAQSESTPRGPAERLAEDVYPGSRLSAFTDERSLDTATTWVAYIATGSRGMPVAKLWFKNPRQGAVGSLTLTEPGASTQSVQLAHTESGEHYALLLEARLGMTTIHARPITGAAAPSLGSDRVVWVGGTAQAGTELTVAGIQERVVVLTALEQDISHFGLAILSFADLGVGEPVVTWNGFPNGLAAPRIVTASACGHVWALFSRPRSAAPRAPFELVLAALSPTGLGDVAVLAEAAALREVSMAGVSGGALIHYVTDTATRVLSLRCNPD